MGRGLSPQQESGTWLGRRWGAASHIAAAGARGARSVRAVARRPLGECRPREVFRGPVSVPWARRAESASAAGGRPQ
eukprot:852238-Alexandrium_andersonii.AAC.1